MLNIKVLGPGCINCVRVYQMAVAALKELEAGLGDDCLEATLQHVTDYDEFMKYGLLFTPGLVINEELVCAGRIPSKREITAWLINALEKSK
jgi:small redox-active disulfide protein 2